MEALHDLLEWCSKQAKVQLLEVCRRPQEGFKKVIVKPDETFYGISPEFDWKDLNSVQNATDASRRGYLSQDFPNTYFERSHRIALDMLERSNKGREGFEFIMVNLRNLRTYQSRKDVVRLIRFWNSQSGTPPILPQLARIYTLAGINTATRACLQSLLCHKS